MDSAPKGGYSDTGSRVQMYGFCAQGGYSDTGSHVNMHGFCSKDGVLRCRFPRKHTWILLQGGTGLRYRFPRKMHGFCSKGGYQDTGSHVKMEGFRSSWVFPRGCWIFPRGPGVFPRGPRVFPRGTWVFTRGCWVFPIGPRGLSKRPPAPRGPLLQEPPCSKGGYQDNVFHVKMHGFCSKGGVPR